MRLIVVGTGLMAKTHATAFGAIDGVELVAAVEPDTARRAGFADAFGIGRAFATLDEALDWGDFDAATNVTPDGVHHATTMPLLAAGKHVLCEKPLATNHADAAEMARAAQAAGVTHMVNLTYRNVAALQAAKMVVETGAIGEVRHLEASYLQSWLTQAAWGDWKTESAWLWRLSSAHGSAGVLGDVGVHILDFASYAAGMGFAQITGQLQTFDKAPGGQIGDYVLDANDSFAMSGRLENGALAAVHASRFASGHLNDLSLKIFGTLGGLEITNTGALGTMRRSGRADLETGSWRDVTLSPVPTNFERFVDAVRGGRGVDPDFAHAARLQGVIDAVIASDAQGQQVDLGEAG